MIQEISRQAAEFFLAGGLGVLLGLFYDVGRSFRRLRSGLTVTVDVLFAVAFFLSLWLMSVYTRGLRAYQCLGIFLGGSVYFLTVSPFLLRGMEWLLRRLGRLGGIIFLPVKKIMYFLRKLAKKCFPSSGKWGTINAIPFSPRPQKTGEARNHRGTKKKQSAEREKTRRRKAFGGASGTAHRGGHVRRRIGPRKDRTADQGASAEPAADRL